MEAFEKPDVLLEVLDAIPDMLRVLDKNRRVVLMNESYSRCFDIKPGSKCYDMFCAGGECRNCISLRTMKTRKPQEKRRRYQGRTYWVKASALYDEEGEPTGSVEVFRDITDLAAREQMLRIQNKRLLMEANLAAQMQRTLFLPENTLLGGLQVDARYLPASSLGGDLFGCFPRDDGKSCFYIADVSGHGIAAAMLTLMLANELKYAWELGESTPTGLLRRAQKAFLASTKDTQLYVTMFIGVFDGGNDGFHWINAGHNGAPFLINGDVVKRLYAPGLPICDWQPEIDYEEHIARLHPGGRLFVYTDGLLDPRSSNLTEQELEKKLIQQKGDALLASLTKKIRNDRADDVCMLLLTRGDE